MKVKVICILADTETEIDIACGNGKKTFKWLALTAAARFSSRIPRGMRRHREVPTITGANASYVPLDVITDGLVFHHPDDFVIEHLADGDSVTVRLGASLPVDDRGQPELTRWSTIAFAVSDIQTEKRTQALVEEKRICDERMAREKEEKRAALAQLYKRKAKAMREEMKNQITDQKRLAAELAADWAALINSPSSERILKTPTEQSKVREILKENYFVLTEVFKHHAANQSGAGTDTMNQHEFQCFIHESDMFPVLSSSILSNYAIPIFAESCEDGDSMTQPNFFEALIRLGRYKIAGLTDWHVSRSSQTDDEHLDPNRPTPECLSDLIVTYLQPHVTKRLHGSAAKNAISADEVLAMYMDNRQPLFNRFLSAAGGDSLELEQSQFMSIIEAAGLMGAQDASLTDELTVKETRQAFAASQADRLGSNTTSASNQLRMSFPEFIEGIARVACVKWKHSHEPPNLKIQRAVEAICAF